MIRNSVLLLCAFIACCYSCNIDQPELSTEEFIIRDGHEIQLIAHEPMIQSPVVMTQDDQGRLWVVEMRGYMRDIDGNGEDIKDGRILILEDTDQDGVMDKSKVFLDKLLNPRAISLVYGGVLYTDSTALVWAEIQNDKPTKYELVDSIYVVGDNLEHQPNGLHYNLDNWIYSAKSNARYKRKNSEWIKEPTTFRGQWGISSDHLGRLVYNHNSAPLIGDWTIPNALLSNPYLEIKEGVGNYYTDDMRLYPIQATSVNRGYAPGVLDSNDILINYTSACSPHIYYGEGLSTNYNSSAFVCAPEANLISNYHIDHHTKSAFKDSNEQEFLISKDETFRPVSLMTSMDDGLYVVDMRKGIIQHTAYMTSYLREKILAKKMDQVNERGRIYRIKNTTNSLTDISFSSIDPNKLPSLFLSKNMSTRIWAQKEIIRRNLRNQDITKYLVQLAHDINNPIPAIHSWWTLDELGLMSNKVIGTLDLDGINEEFAIGILPLLRKYDAAWVYKSKTQFINIYRKMIELDDYAVDLNLAPNLGAISNYWPEWWQLAKKYKNDKAIIEALVSSNSPSLSHFMEEAQRREGYMLLIESISESLENQKTKSIQTPKFITKEKEDFRTVGLKKFKQYCTSCHGYDGKGIKNMAPSLVDSKIIKGPEKEITRIILEGYSSGNNDFQMMMPSYINDPNMTDKDISDLVAYLLSTFAKRWGGISVEDVAKIRTQILENKTNR